jgi:hypothetical protein
MIDKSTSVIVPHVNLPVTQRPNLPLSFSNLLVTYPLIKTQKPTLLGRFQYWLHTSPLTILRLVLHCPPDTLSLICQN